MKNRERADSVADLVHSFAQKHVAPGEAIETVAADIIGSILHLVKRTHEMGGGDGRKHALTAARGGLSAFISEVHAAGPQDTRSECYTLITVRTESGLWVSETGFEDVIQ